MPKRIQFVVLNRNYVLEVRVNKISVETRKHTARSIAKRKWRKSVHPRYAAIHLSRSNEV